MDIPTSFQIRPLPC